MRTVLEQIFSAMHSGDDARVNEHLAHSYEAVSASLPPKEQHAAQILRQQLHAMMQKEADGARKAYAEKVLSLGILQHEPQLERALEAVSQFTHSTMHAIDESNQRKAQAFDEHEQNLLRTRGKLGYAASLMTRRFSTEHHFQHVHVPAPESAEPASPDRPALRSLRKGGLNIARLAQDTPPPPPKMDTLEADALSRYGAISPVHTPMQKLRFAGGIIASIGLIAHGGKNIMEGFSPAPSAATHSPDDTPSSPPTATPSQIIAGALESSLGIAFGVRALTGRWNITKPVQSSLQKLLDCTHDIRR